ncbi:MAG: hypothetical protein K2Z81_06695 [Cyanobacteria bacterium]|nr:hypothetical protein [Cyanobacteriota bacterium]
MTQAFQQTQDLALKIISYGATVKACTMVAYSEGIVGPFYMYVIENSKIPKDIREAMEFASEKCTEELRDGFHSDPRFRKLSDFMDKQEDSYTYGIVDNTHLITHFYSFWYSL